MTELIVALDVSDRHHAVALAQAVAPVRWVKVGLELFMHAGPDVVAALRDLGLNVMLDLKLHDIPETVRRAALTANATGAAMLTVHASGGVPMLRGVADVLKHADMKPLAVTVLTSLDAADLYMLGVLPMQDDVPTPVAVQVQRLARLAYEQANIRGFVCSPHEVTTVRYTAPDATIVVPGIRLPDADCPDDQKRVATPAAAKAAGADFIVVGRPIRDSQDVSGTVQRFLEQLA